MLLITNKVRMVIKNQLRAKQKRIVHDISVFDVELEKFIGIMEIVPHAKIRLFVSPAGTYATLDYSYQGNEYKYFLRDEQIEAFQKIADQKNLNLKIHEI